MKKMLMSLFLIMFALLFCSTVSATVDSWMPANQFTVTWDAVTTHGDGTALPTGGIIEYEIVMANVDRLNPQVLWSGVETTTALTMPTIGRYLLGIKSILKVENEVVAESEYSWSDDPEVVGNGTFGILYFKAPSKVTGLMRQ